jgi:hypothetical protein
MVLEELINLLKCRRCNFFSKKKLFLKNIYTLSGIYTHIKYKKQVLAQSRCISFFYYIHLKLLKTIFNFSIPLSHNFRTIFFYVSNYHVGMVSYKKEKPNC